MQTAQTTWWCKAQREPGLYRRPRVYHIKTKYARGVVKTKYHSATMAHHSRSHAITDFIFLRPIREKWLFGHVVAAESRRQPPPVMVQAGGVLGRRAAAAGWRRSEVFAIAAAGALLLVATVVLKAPGRAEVGACCALPPQRQLVSCVG